MPGLVNRLIVGMTLAAMQLIGAEGIAHAEEIIYFNDLPELQMYSYPAGSSNGAGGVRDRAATFAGFSSIENGQPVFYEGTGANPSRRGSFMIAANTATAIPLLDDPSRYQIDSVRLTLTFMGSLIYPEFGMFLPFDGTQDSSVDLTTGADADPGRPIEMYGVGLQGEYETFGFAPSQTGPEYFRLGTARWQALQPGEPGYVEGEFNTTGPYKYFAVDAAGRDAENAVAGGYSATESTGSTSPFTPTPFAIGQAYDAQGLARLSGDLLEPGDTIVFEANLSDPGVTAYLQNSLAAGHLAFTFSSLHQPEGHAGTAPYPDFYLDDLDVGPNADGAGPTIDVAVTLLPAEEPSDFNADGVVDGGDFLLWQRELGAHGAPAGSGADGNGDGAVTGVDLTMWQQHFGATTDANQEIGATAVPEPTSGIAALLATVLAGLTWRRVERSA